MSSTNIRYIAALTGVAFLLALDLASGSERITEEELKRVQEEALSAWKSGDHEEATEKLLYVFDNSRGVSSYGGVRVSFVPSYLAQIGREYPPAIVELRIRRNTARDAILDGQAGFGEVQEFSSLSRYLGEIEEPLRIYDELVEADGVSTEVVQHLRLTLWDQLVDAGRYEELREEAKLKATMLVMSIGRLEAGPDFNSTIEAPARLARFQENQLRTDGSKTYLVFLALGDSQRAEALERRLLAFDGSVEMYKKLIEAARTAEDTESESRLFLAAQEELSRKDFEVL